MGGLFQVASAWTDAFLEPMRQVGDGPADAAIRAMFDAGDVNSVNTLMRTLVSNDQMAPEALPEAVKTFLATTEDLPPFADAAKIKMGEELFWEWGPQMVFVLLTYSLPYCYAAKKGVQVLALTARLSNNAERRIIEVAQMMVDVLQPGGLTSPDGRGRRTLQKVRLMHAAVRHLASTSPQWDPAWDLPINQEDIAGTLMSFSWIIFDGLRKIGVTVSAEQQEAYLHCWQIIGEQLGLREDMLPADMASAEALTHAIMRRQYGACPEGQMMTKALVDMMQYTLPGNMLDPFVPMYLSYFLGEENAALLGIEERGVGWLRAFNGLDVVMTGVNQDKAMAKLAEKMSRMLINAAVMIARGGNRPMFAIPQELRQQWGVNWLG